MKTIRLTHSYITSIATFDETTLKREQECQHSDYIFVDYFHKLHKEITTDNLISVYPLVDYSRKMIEAYIRHLLIEKFELDNSISIISFDYKEGMQISEHDMVIKFGCINDVRLIDLISKLTLYYKDVYIVNFIYDNPLDDSYYVVVKGVNNTVNKQIEHLVVNNYDYITNINENKEDIYMFLYTCYFYWSNLLKATITNNHKVLDTHFKTLKLIKHVSQTVEDNTRTT